MSTAPDIIDLETDAFTDGYVPVNQAFADAVIEEVEACGGHATVMVQDYHFYLVPELVRARCPGAFLHHFVHIPWPQPDAWRVLPPSMREAVLRGVLGNDVVAFPRRALRPQLPAGLPGAPRAARRPRAAHGWRRRPNGAGPLVPHLRRRGRFRGHGGVTGRA